MPTTPRYIDPLSDFGFKHLFGREQSKPALVHFLNSLLPPERHVADLEFIPSELTGDSPTDRTVSVDLHCRATDGSTFIVEIQRRRQDHFRDRSLLYVARALSREAMRGDWNYNFEPIVLIALLEFKPAETASEERYIHEASLRTADGRPFSDTITIIHVELPKFKKELPELDSPLDYWLYLSKNLREMTEVPQQFSARVFTDWITEAEFAQLSPADQLAYDRYWFARNDRQNQDAYARREAIEEGLEEGLERGLTQGLTQGLAQGLTQGEKNGLQNERTRMVRSFAENGMSVEQIATFSNLSEAEVRSALEGD